jgi:hypothetical protein
VPLLTDEFLLRSDDAAGQVHINEGKFGFIGHYPSPWRSSPRNDSGCALSPKCCETGTRYHRNPLVSWIGDDIEQRLDTLASNRSDDPELGKVGPDHIDHRSLLANEQMPRAMERQATLLFGRLGRDAKR